MSQLCNCHETCVLMHVDKQNLHTTNKLYRFRLKKILDNTTYKEAMRRLS